MRRFFTTRAIYTFFFLFIFVVSADLIVVFSSIWEHEGVSLYGSPLASRNLSSGDILINGLVIDFLLWGILAFFVSGVLLRFWHWSAKQQFFSLFTLIATALTLYNTDIFENSLSSGWPLVAINSAQINLEAILLNTLVAVLLSGVAYVLVHAIRQSEFIVPKIQKALPILGALCVLFVTLAIFLPSQGGTSWEMFIQGHFVLKYGLVREIMTFITLMSASGAALFLSLVVFLALREQDLRLAVLPLISSLILIITVPEMKELIERVRPETGSAITDDYALPAGHAAVGTIYLFLGLLLYKKNSLLLIIFASLALFSGLIRILLGLHWFGDLMAGWIWGAIVYLFAWLLIYIISTLLKDKWKR